MISYEEVNDLFSYDISTGKIYNKVTRAPLAKAGFEAGHYYRPNSRSKLIHRRVMIKGKFYKVHRVIWLMVYGKWPSEQIDHIDGNGLNNVLSNLREATAAQNLRNSSIRKNNRCGFKGVYFDRKKKRFLAGITVNYKRKTLGSFKTAEEAHEAYCKAASVYHGEFARFR